MAYMGSSKRRRNYCRDDKDQAHLSCPQDRDTTYFSFESHTFIRRALRHHQSSSTPSVMCLAFRGDPQLGLTYRRSLDYLLYDRKVVQPLLNEQPNDTIRVEEEISPTGLFVSDDRVKRLQLGRLG